MVIEKLLIILVGAALGRVIAKSLGQPAMIGEVIIGVLIGQFGFIKFGSEFQLLADIGALILLFSTGLYMDVSKINDLKNHSTLVALLGIVVPFTLGFSVCYYVNYSLLPSLFVGGALSITSISVKAATLKDHGTLRNQLGALIMGSAVIDDVIGVTILAILSGLIGLSSSLFFGLSWILSGVIILFGVLLPLGVKLIRRVPGIVLPRDKHLVMLALIIVFSLALLSKRLHLGMMIGAFLGGLIFSESKFTQKVLQDMVAFGEAFFVPIFFVSMGISFDIQALSGVVPFAFLILLIAVGSKIIGCGLGTKLCNYSWQASLTVGIAMVPRAELALVLARTGYENGVIGSEILAIILLTVIITVLMTPFLLKKCGLRELSEN